MEETNKKHRWKYLGRGWHSNESASLAPLWPELSLSLVLACTSKVYLWVHWFSFHQKNQHSSLTWKQWTWRVTSWKVQCKIPNIIIISTTIIIIVIICWDGCVGLNEEVLLQCFACLFLLCNFGFIAPVWEIPEIMLFFIFFITGCDRSNCRMCLQDIRIPCYSFLWESLQVKWMLSQLLI